MSFKPFVRQLGAQPGVQLNPLKDTTDGVSLDDSDQVLAMVVRTTRGRIDRPFRVTRGTFLTKTGAPDTMRANALNEGRLQLSEALNNGALSAVVSRIVPAAAAKSYIAIDLDAA